MAVSEQRRRDLYTDVAAVINEQAAATLLELLPPAGLDVATSADIRRLERRLDGIDQRLDGIEDRLDLKLDLLRNELLAAFRNEIVTAVSGQMRAALIASLTTTFSIVLAALALAQLL